MFTQVNKTMFLLGVGFALTVLGFFGVWYSHSLILFAILNFGGTILFTWGCWLFAKVKGYSGALGLLGLYGIIGLLILWILPSQISRREDAFISTVQQRYERDIKSLVQFLPVFKAGVALSILLGLASFILYFNPRLIPNANADLYPLLGILFLILAPIFFFHSVRWRQHLVRVLQHEVPESMLISIEVKQEGLYVVLSSEIDSKERNKKWKVKKQEMESLVAPAILGNS